METGKVEFAPDYKSEKRIQQIASDGICAGCGTPFTYANANAVKTQNWQKFCSPKCQHNPDVDAECVRLESEVIEAAKVWRKLLAEITTAMASRAGGTLSEDLIALNQRRVDVEVLLIAATDALNEFESQHGIQK